MTKNTAVPPAPAAMEPRWLQGGELTAWMSMARVLARLLPALERERWSATPT